MTDETLGQRIKKLRIDKGLSQDELAKMMGYTSRSTINKIEMDKNDVSHNKLLRFADMLGASPAYLLTGSRNGAVNTLTIITLENEEITVQLSDDEVSQVVQLLCSFQKKEDDE